MACHDSTSNEAEHRETREAPARGSARITIALLALLVLAAGLVVIALMRSPQETVPDAAHANTSDNSQAKAPPTFGPGDGTTDTAPRRSIEGPPTRLEPPADATTPAAAPTLEVTVRIDDEAVTGGAVEVWEVTEFGREVRGEGDIDPDGTCRIDGLEDGHRFGVDVRLASGHTATREILMRGDTRLLFELGTARIFGTVFDSAGAPLGGATVRVRSGAAMIRSEATTDPGGTYSIDSLPDGEHAMTVTAPGADTLAIGTRTLELDVAEHRQVDFGSSPNLSTWSGVLRRRDGTPAAPLDGRARYVYIHTPGSGQSSEPEQTHAYSADAAFSMPLDAGEYDVWIDSPTCRSRLLLRERFRMPGGDHREDMTIDGTAITGTILGFDPVSAVPRIQLIPVGTTSGERFVRMSTIQPDGRFAFDGIDAGVWNLVYRGGDQDLERELVIAAGDATRTIDLEM